MGETDFTSMGRLVDKASELLDSIKGGAIRVMQTEFDALKQKFNDKLTSVSGELNSFVIQQKNSVNSIFSDPDSRYQKVAPLTVDIGGDTDKFYPVIVRAGANRISTLSIGRDVHRNGQWKGAMLASFELVESGYSTRPGLIVLNRLMTHLHGSATPNMDLLSKDGFLAGFTMSNTVPSGGIFWLRGGYSYDFHTDGNPLKTIKEYTAVTDRHEGDISVCMGGYAGGSKVFDVKTARDTALVPEFSSYERA